MKPWIDDWLRPGDCCVDIGAHIGDITKDLAERVGPTGRVLAIEPVSANAKQLRERVKELPQALVWQWALSDHSEVVTLHLDDSHPAVCSLWAANALTPSGTEDVLASCLDVLLDAGAVPPVRFIKVDAQGAEYKILQGATRTLQTRPLAIWMELWDYGLKNAGSSAQAVCDLLAAAGFQALDESRRVRAWPDVVSMAERSCRDVPHSAIDVWVQADA